MFFALFNFETFSCKSKYKVLKKEIAFYFQHRAFKTFVEINLLEEKITKLKVVYFFLNSAYGNCLDSSKTSNTQNYLFLKCWSSISRRKIFIKAAYDVIKLKFLNNFFI